APGYWAYRQGPRGSVCSADGRTSAGVHGSGPSLGSVDARQRGEGFGVQIATGVVAAELIRLEGAQRQLRPIIELVASRAGRVAQRREPLRDGARVSILGVVVLHRVQMPWRYLK